ncbi:hypothetical protein TNCV_3961831 [Trichonephila clavipes]|nr:hypothetical protein TNCV_3961831 [Trichonephila clavipes]
MWPSQYTGPHWTLRSISRCPNQVVSLKRTPQSLIPKQAWYSFIDPLKGWKAESTLLSTGTEPRTYGVETRYATTRPLGLTNPLEENIFLTVTLA